MKLGYRLARAYGPNFLPDFRNRAPDREHVGSGNDSLFLGFSPMATSSSSARLLAGLLLASLLPAQGVPELEFDRVQITWPNQPNGPYSFSGLDRTMACGAFLDGFDGRSVVVIRGTNLYMSFQPVLFEHLVGVPTPVAPGAFDYGRRLWFESIGGTGK